MSTPTTIQGRQFPISVSSDNITYKNVLCNTAWDLNIDNSANQDESDCGVHTSLGAVKWSFNVEGIVNTTPNGATELSAKALLELANNQTLSYIKTLYPAVTGTDLYMQGQGYFTNLKIVKSTNSLLTFTATFTGDGTLDTSA